MAIGIGLLAAGTVLSTFGTFAAGRAARRAAREQAQALEQAAGEARAFAAFNARRQRERDAVTLGEFRTAVAAAGVRLEGAPLAAYGDQVRQAELNALSIVFEGELRARGFERQARLTRREGRAAGVAGGVDTLTVALTGGARLAGRG